MDACDIEGPVAVDFPDRADNASLY